MQISKRAGLGLALACLMGSMTAKPALAADKVSLFKVITAKDEIVIGLSDDELTAMDGNAGGVAKMLVARGSLSVWQYAVALVSAKECAFLPHAAAWVRAPAACLRESAMVSTILIVLLIVALMVGLSGRVGGYGFGHGHSGMGLIGVILVVLLVLKLLRKI